MTKGLRSGKILQIMAQGPEGIELFTSLEQALRATNDPRDVERADHLAVMLRARGQDLVYHPRNTVTEATHVPVLDLFARVYPEITLSEEHQRQGLILAGRFAASLNMSKKLILLTCLNFQKNQLIILL